jgi:hypothetical protein
MLYFVLVGFIEAANLDEHYPIIYVAISMVAQTLVVCGVVLFALEAGDRFAQLWRWLFPLLVLELAVGIMFDASVPPDVDPSSPGWILNLIFGLWLLAPAYYFNFRIARYAS